MRFILASALLVFPLLVGAQEAKPSAKSRTFRLTYAGAITGLEPGRTVSVWLPIPRNTDEQEVLEESKKLPEGVREFEEGEYNNRMYHFEAKAGPDGTIPYEVVYKITRKEVRGMTDTQDRDPRRIERFLQADQLVPLTGKPLDLIKGQSLPADPTARAKAFYEAVNSHMKYDKSKPGWGRGDAVWACDSKFGNCTDFHSLFISLARAHKIPAKFEIGLSIPEKQGKGEVPGYHCWAKFRPGDGGWVGVDISEANKEPKLKDYYFGNLTADRVTLSTGRDIDLAPRQKSKPLNFFVFPHAEVEGKAVDQTKIIKKNAYEDVK